MCRDWKVYIEDITTAIEKVERYMINQTMDDFMENSEKQDAVIKILK